MRQNHSAAEARQCQSFWRAEAESAHLYAQLASRETDATRADLLRRLAATEAKHRDAWARRLHALGEPPPTYISGWRAQALAWAADRFGAEAVLPLLAANEKEADTRYRDSTLAEAKGMAVQERGHARIFTAMRAGRSRYRRSRIGNPGGSSPHGGRQRAARGGAGRE